MKILLLHLSDIHFASKDDRVARRAGKLKEAVAGSFRGADACFIAISGDIARTGDPGEYSVALYFLNELRESLMLAGINQVEIVLVPGNHDCNLRSQVDTREFVLGSLNSYLSKPINLNGANFEAVISVQEDFFQFDAAARNGDPVPIAQRLYFPRQYNVTAGSVIFHCFNTAWLSRRNEVQSELYIPPEVLQGSADLHPVLTVAMFHHPYNWINAENCRILKDFVETNADIVLTGHEHAGEISRKQGFDGLQIDYVEAPALQDVITGSSGFQILCLDTDASEQDMKRFEWKETYYSPTRSQSWTLSHNTARPDKPFKPNPVFEKELRAVGVGIKHPRCTPPHRELILRDIYIYPDLRDRDIDKAIAGEKVYSSNIPGEQIVSLIESKKRVIIYGTDDSGKTSLAKILFEDFINRDITPLMIVGEALQKIKTDKALDALLRDAVGIQYSEVVAEQYMQLDPTKKLLIIDDFHKCQLSRAGQDRIIQDLLKMYGMIVVMASDIFGIQQLARTDEDTRVFGEFQKCDLKEFGKFHLHRLVEKWHLLGQEDSAEPEELSEDVIRSEKTISTLMGKNVLPHYPLTILTILQLMETTENPNMANGSYGYLYEVLIKTALAGAGSSTRDVDLQVTYLSGIAHSMFKGKARTLTEAEFLRAHEEYCDRYDISRQFSQMLAVFRRSEILVERTRKLYQFKYPYMFYYFVAKYLQENAGTLRDELNQIADHIYNETNANILIFYVYLTKDAALIRSLTEQSKKIYEEHAPCDLDDDIAFVNTLYTTTPPPLRLESTDFRTNRENYYRKQDQVAEASGTDEREDDPEGAWVKYDRELQDIVKISIAFKTLNILGQVLRNFPGSLDRELKLEIIRECYSLGMRTLNALLAIARNNLDAVRQHIGSMIAERTGLSDAELANRTDKAIVWLATAAAFGTIKRISYAVGHQDLMPTYDRMLEEDGALATRVIDVAIRLDYSDVVPQLALKRLRSDVSSNIFSFVVCRDLVADFMYLYRVDASDVQMLGSTWDIKIAAPALLANRSKKT